MDADAALELIRAGFDSALEVDKDSRGLLEELTEQEALDLGREAWHAALAPLMLRALLGADRFDTSSAARLLQVTRQALHKRVKSGGLLAIPGRGTSWYPAWQFDVGGRVVRPSATAVLAAWTEVLGSAYDPETVLAWSASPQPELGGRVPAAWIEAGGEAEPVVEAARRAARGLAA